MSLVFNFCWLSIVDWFETLLILDWCETFVDWVWTLLIGVKLLSLVCNFNLDLYYRGCNLCRLVWRHFAFLWMNFYKIKTLIHLKIEIISKNLLWLDHKNQIIRKNFRNFKVELNITRKWRVTNIINIYLNQNLKLLIIQFNRYKKHWRGEGMFLFIRNVESLNWDSERFTIWGQGVNQFLKLQMLLV